MSTPKSTKVPRIASDRIQVVSDTETYKCRSARPQFYNERLLDTESTDMTARQGHILLQKNLQIQFLAQENEDLRNKVQNLEGIVQANKLMMASLLSPSEDQESTSDLEKQVKDQSELLEKRVAELEKQLEDKSAQMLVMTQIIQNQQNQDDATDLATLQEKQVMIDDMNHKEYLLQKYEMKIYHYEKYLLKKGQFENEARQLLQQFRLEQPLSDQKVSNAVSDNFNLRHKVTQLEAQLTKIKDVREKDKQTIANLENTIENMQQKKQHVQERRSLPEADFFQAHQLKMLPSLRLSIIGEDGNENTIVASGWTSTCENGNTKRRESITTDGCIASLKQPVTGARRDTIQEIVQSFN